ncbi:hypothetical protein JYK14_16995 [Siccirubricoccus sp. KC 17139]|uniref:Uncharacterized protein n=1 Tax=Siccirubricoccus soli TaxID=2899147 RepID=A0ABT1D7E4_9PROT|nr:hypothetical protein [Siccirubricoccus soli]MCO6417847.1 hypothetical protein [Siccirubricoccus soli]MCP2683982.1 hypothetical protein [Siccirubricoccus soli]
MSFIRPLGRKSLNLLLDPHGDGLRPARGLVLALLLSAGFWLGVALLLGAL